MDIASGRSLASRGSSYEGGATTTANLCCQITTEQFDKVHLTLKRTNLKNRCRAKVKVFDMEELLPNIWTCLCYL